MVLRVSAAAPAEPPLPPCCQAHCGACRRCASVQQQFDHLVAVRQRSCSVAAFRLRVRRRSAGFACWLQHTDPRTMAWLSDSEECYFPKGRPSTHFSDDSGVHGRSAGFRRRGSPVALGAGSQRSLLVQSEQHPVPGAEARGSAAFDGSGSDSAACGPLVRYVCCEIHSGQATTSILSGMALVP